MGYYGVSVFDWRGDEKIARDSPLLWMEFSLSRSKKRGVVLDTTAEGPHSLFVQIVTVFVQIRQNILNGSDV